MMNVWNASPPLRHVSVEPPSLRQAEADVLSLQGTSEIFAALMLRYGYKAPALRHFGLIRWGERNFEASARALLCALTLGGDPSHLWRDLAGVFEGAADIERAEFCIRKAIDVDPHHGDSWLLLGNLAKRREDLDVAEDAYRRAIDLDPALASAHFGLGVVQFEQRRFADAIAGFRTTVELDPALALGHVCLGQVLYAVGDFPAAAAAFDAAARIAPLDIASRQKHARALTFESIMDGRPEAALDAYPELAADDREDIEVISRDAFALLSAHGHRRAAIEIGRIRLAQRPDDPIRRYLLDAVSGRPLTRAPTDYIEAYFDRFAPQFDGKVVDVLRYDTPQRLTDLLKVHDRAFTDILDLGCGTGLAADHLATFGGRLTGVDLSGGMLDEAHKRSRYDALLKSEAVAFLNDNAATFDLVFAADMLIYFGDLSPVVEAVSTALRPGGVFAFSIETTDIADFVLLSSGRFAHSPAYVERLAGPAFEILARVDARIRLEAYHPVQGHLLVLRRR